MRPFLVPFIIMNRRWQDKLFVQITSMPGALTPGGIMKSLHDLFGKNKPN